MPQQDKIIDSTEEFERAYAAERGEKIILRLYVSGMTARSIRAIENMRRICNEDLKGRCELEVIDVYQQPERSKEEQLFAAPTLIKKLPLPLRRFIGDMSDKEKILVGLNIIKSSKNIKEPSK